MNRFKHKAFITEFPALATLAPDCRYCEKITIARVNKELLTSTPSHNTWTGSMVGTDTKEEVSFILNDGSVLENVVAQKGEHGSNYAYNDTIYKEGETILEAIYRLGCAETLTQIIIINSGYEIVDHYSTNLCSIAIYKAAKTISVQSLIHEAEQSALQQVRAEANF